MMICKECKGTSIKTRRNYSHGKKSKPTVTLTCKKCGSVDIDTNLNRNKRRGHRR